VAGGLSGTAATRREWTLLAGSRGRKQRRRRRPLVTTLLKGGNGEIDIVNGGGNGR